MKNIAIIIILFQSFQSTIAQHVFTQTEEFEVSTKVMKKENTPPSYRINLVHSDKKDTDNIATFTIEDTDLFEDVFVTSLNNPGLEGVSKVIKMEIEYLACCAHVEAYYYLVKEDNTTVLLPELKNVYCENSDTDLQYIFPNQKYGIEGNILKTETIYQETETTTDIKYVNLKQSYAWNDGDVIKKSKTTAITGY
ncbi:hypothetical protein [Aquimarina aquimarini]|uniref:hypothetical protein n=1 Tax=Aquimarina aquimarini TaxID=1191734 RepID=UPI000D561361|nr:hypothetical protein [Aquimarina aquimarini]